MRHPTQFNVVKKYLSKFPDLPNRTLARKINSDEPVIFPTIDSARDAIRYARGSRGDSHRKTVKTKEYFTPENIEKLLTLPDSPIIPFTPFEIPPNIERLLVLSDLQIPFQTRAVVIEALEYGLKKKVNAILLNGDILDFFQQSEYLKEPTKTFLIDEINQGKEFLSDLRKIFPDIPIYFKEGNHEERWPRYLVRHAPVLFDFTEFQLEVILNLGGLRIQYIKDKNTIRFGKLNFIHGHEYDGWGAKVVNPAKWLFTKSMTNTVCGHFNVINQHSGNDILGRQIACWSMGCLSDLHPKFRRHNSWQHGWGYAERLDESGNFRFKNIEYEKDYI